MREERGRRAYLWERGMGGAEGANAVLGDPAGAVRALRRHEAERSPEEERRGGSLGEGGRESGVRERRWREWRREARRRVEVVGVRR